MRNDKENASVNISFQLALKIIDFSEVLRTNKKYELASQLFRSGTSIGANIWEAQNAQSNADFIHKFKIAGKECDELGFWLRLCTESEHCPKPHDELLKMHQTINLIISKIIASCKRQ